MNISLVTETFPPEINGVAMTLERLSLGLAKLGHRVQVIRPRQKEEPEPRPAFEEIAVGAIPLPGYSELNMGLPVLSRIDGLWHRNRPDAVYLATEGPLGIAALLVALARDVMPVSGFHTNFDQYLEHYQLKWLRPIAAEYLRTVHNSTSRTFGPSGDLLGRLRETGFRNLRLLERGVDISLFDPARRSQKLRGEWGAEPEDPVFLFVGRIASEKNIELFFEAWSRIRAVRPNAKVVLVGDGPARAELEARWPGAHFAGARRNEDLAAHYASADFFLFPSLTETFGNVVTEALASGLAVLAFDYAAPRKFIRDGLNGRIVPFADTAAFLAAAEEFAAEKSDWTPMRKQARITGLTLSWDAVLERFADDLSEALAQRQRERREQI